MSVEHNDITSIRLQLYDLGYEPIPTCGKYPGLSGWNASDYVLKQISANAKGDSVRRITSLLRRFPWAVSTGVRLTGGLGAADLDINDKPMIDALFRALQRIAPDVEANAPVRYGSDSEKLALFVRIEGKPFIRIGSHKYRRPNDPPKVYHHAEIFGGKPNNNGDVSRQFAVFGPRKFNLNAAGKSHRAYVESGVASTYEWAADAPALNEIALGDLPAFTEDQAWELVDAFEAAAEAMGWIRIEGADEGTGEGTDIFDIDREHTRFDVWQGEKGVSYDDLENLYHIRDDLRVSPEFIDNEVSDSHDRCKVYWSKRFDCAVVKDWKTDARHYPKEFQPIDVAAFGAELKAAADKLGWEAPRVAGTGTASFKQKIDYLLANYAHYAFEDKIVELHSATNECQLKPLGFQRKYRSWFEDKTGPMGGAKRVYAALCWETSPRRLNIAGVRMRPDQPFPLYEEKGLTFKNTYRKPQHEGQGDITPWLRFMAHLLPAPVEREWFLDWLAHKWQHPEIPGVGIVMVASQYGKPVYGCGRGMLFSILGRLFDPAYVKMIDFDVFSGQSSQAVFTDWQANTLILGVSEAKDTIDSGRYTAKRAIFERIKEVIEPRPVRKTVTPKGKPAYTAICYGTVIIFSNHADALQLPADERRIAGLRNGDRMAAVMAIGLQAWMDNPGNIAALARWLEARNVSAFNVFEPLRTETKSIMEDLARTELDEAFDEVVATVGPNGVFTTSQIIKAVANEMGHPRIERIEDAVRRKVRAAAKRLHGLRMPPAAYREWILVWRDSDTKHINDAKAAQIAVGHTGRRLLEKFSNLSNQVVGQLLNFPVDPKKED